MSQENPTPNTEDTEVSEVVKQKRDKSPKGLLWVVCVLSALTFINSVILVVIVAVGVMQYSKVTPIPYSDPYCYEQPTYDDYGSIEPRSAEPAPQSPESSSTPATTTNSAL